jgi:hypothetical protein
MNHPACLSFSNAGCCLPVLNDLISKAGLCLVFVLYDQGYLAVSISNLVAALAALRLPADPVGMQSVPSVVVTNALRIAVTDNFVDCSVPLASISQNDQPELSQ